MNRYPWMIVIAALLLALASCNSAPEGKKVKAKAAKKVGQKSAKAGVAFKLDGETSKVYWKGAKPGGKHKGTVVVSDGTLQESDGNLTGGSFTIDMKSIDNTDLEGEMKGKLEGHLKSADFFDVDKFPTASFEITNVEKIRTEANRSQPNQKITGNFTMKGKTNSISFDARVIVQGDMMKAKTEKFTIDRTQWDVKYGSGKFFDNLADNVINDEIGLEINLIAKR